MKKGLITGANGKLGNYFLKRFFSSGYEISGIDKIWENIPPELKVKTVDILDNSLLWKIVLEIKPDFIIHCAAIKDVFYCEEHPEDTWLVNVVGTQNIVEICEELGIKLIFISSDYVFDGEKGWYAEEDIPNPQTCYGQSKLKGEEIIKEKLSDYVICRTGGIFGYNDDFIDWVKEKLVQRKEVNAYSNIFNTPTYLPSLTEMIEEIMQRNIEGTFHLAGRERINRFGFALKIAKEFNLDLNLVKEERYEDKIDKGLRPRDLSLCSLKAQKVLKTKFLSIDETLRHIRRFNNVKNRMKDEWDS
ncbi:MAG: NAD(P)-dependent oxidoreductase [bacterium]